MLKNDNSEQNVLITKLKTDNSELVELNEKLKKENKKLIADINFLKPKPPVLEMNVAVSINMEEILKLMKQNGIQI